MSSETNTLLLEEAVEYIDIYTDTTVGTMLEKAVGELDLALVRQLVSVCRALDITSEETP